MEKNYCVVFTGKKQVEIQECEMPTPGANEVLIKSIVTQISTGTDLTRLVQNVDENSNWLRLKNYMDFPIFPGCSNVGEIIAVGEGCDTSLIGKKVSSTLKHRKYGVCSIGNFDVLSDDINPDDAAFQTLSVVALASIRAAKIKPGETVIVFGAGVVGQLVARLVKIAGAINVVVVDVSDNRLNYVPKRKGFYIVNSTKESVEEIVKNINYGKLADVVFETTGYHPLVEKELKCIAKMGRLIITSSPKGASNVDFQYCSGMGLTIIGAHNYTIHPPVETPNNPWTRSRDAKYFIRLLEHEELSLKNMVTHKENYTNAVKLYNLLMEDRTQALAVHIDWRD